MSDSRSIPNWLLGLQDGDAAAMQNLWEGFHQKLLRVADKQLKSVISLDGEDVVASVFESVWNASQGGRLRHVANVDELLWMLLAMTRRKCIDHLRRSNAARRGGGTAPLSLSASEELFQEIVSQDPDPRYVAELNEQFLCILNRMPEPICRQIAVLKLEGYSNEEIALKIDLAVATVQRKLKIIRRLFQDEFFG